MANNGGWIKLHRKIVDNWIWNDPEKLRAWLDILLMVNHEDKEIPVNGKIVTIKRGQKLTSLVKLAERWGWNKKRVVRFLDLLSGSDMVHAKGYAFGTVLTVVNWDLYQLEGYTVGTAVGTAKGYATGYTVGTQTRMNKNDKEIKNARTREADRETKQGIQRRQNLDEWLRQQTQKRVFDGGEENDSD